MKNIMLFFLVLLLSSQVMAQQGRINGIVIDGKDGTPMAGANVQIKGTTNGAITDVDGKFSLNVTTDGSILVITSVGYKSQSMKIGSKRDFKITLEENSKLLDEVVVVGYGTMKKRDLSGAVGSIKSEDLMKGNPADLSQGLQGKIAGVQIQQSDGAPGAGVSIQIRGANSFSTSTQPLYVVDGVPFETGSTPSGDSNVNETSNPLTFINPHDIQSIEVLKDASATAIYGSRGANGVVIITTKRGEAGVDKVEFSSNVTISNIGKKVHVLDGATYASYINEETLNSYTYEGKPYTTLPYPGTWNYSYSSDGTPNRSSGKYTGKPDDFNHPGLYKDSYGNSTEIASADWQDLIYQTGYSQEYNLSVSGGSEKGFHSYSGNYLKQDGIIKNSGFSRYSLRANIGRHVYNWLEIGANINFTHTYTDFAKTNAYDYGVIRSALLFPTTYGPNMDTTTADNLNWLAANPYAYVQSAKDHLKAINVFTSSYAEIKLLPYLKFRQNLGLSYTNNDRGFYYDRHTQEGKAPINGKGGQGDSDWEGLTAESLLTFDKTFNKIHAINALAGFTVEHDSWNSKSIVVTNFPDDLTEEYDLSRAIDKATLTSDKGEQSLVSFLGRVNYALMDKYLFTASFRRDGSSKFLTKNKWANFLSGAIAWRASEEPFIKNLNIFDNLKFRLSYGETGNQAISSYRSLPMLGSANYPFNGTTTSGSASVDWRGPVADNLKWETTKQYNAGIDFSLLRNRINMTVDYYQKKTIDLLQEIKIPKSTGYSNMMVNSGNVTNEGLEITGNFILLKNTPLKWDLTANISFNKNKIGGLSADQYANSLWYKADEVFLQRNGCPVGTIYGYVENGFYNNEAEVRAVKKYANASDAVVKAMIGEIKYRDMNGDGEITDADRTIIGNTNPDFIYGITNNFSYKNFSLSFLFQGSYGNDIFNGNLMDVKLGNIGNIPVDAYNSRWTENNTANAKWPKATAGYSRTMLISNRYVENGSYLKLKNLTLGYTWKPKFKGIDNVNLYFTGTNLFTITKYSWFDPDVNAFGTDASRRGVDIYSYPSARTFSLGLKVGF